MAANESQIIAFDVLMFFAILLLVLALVPPLFSRHIVRRKTWHSVMLSMLILSIGEVLLVGRQFEPSPNPNLCLVQVAVIHATPPLWVQRFSRSNAGAHDIQCRCCYGFLYRGCRSIPLPCFRSDT